MKKENRIKLVVFFLIGVFIDRYFMKKLCLQIDNLYRETAKRVKRITIQYNRVTKKWNIITALALNRIDINEVCSEKTYFNIAIYGLGEIGEYVISKLLLHGKVKVAYIIDQNKAGGFYNNIPIYSLKDALPETDIIIVTTVMNFTEISYELFHKTQAEVVSIEKIILGD